MKGCLKKTFATIILIVLLLTTTNVMSIAAEIGDEIVNYEVLIKLKSEKEVVNAGEEQKITIKNSYSTPNAKGNAHIKVHITDEDGNPKTFMLHGHIHATQDQQFLDAYQEYIHQNFLLQICSVLLRNTNWL